VAIGQAEIRDDGQKSLCMPGRRRGAEALGIAENLICRECAVMMRHQFRRGRRPLLQMTARAAKAEVDTARFVPAEKRERLGLNDFPLAAIA
jgi:hypothetical protein